MYFKTCFSMVVMHSGVNTRIVYELQAYIHIFCMGLPASVEKDNKQSVNMPYYNVGHC